MKKQYIVPAIRVIQLRCNSILQYSVMRYRDTTKLDVGDNED